MNHDDASGLQNRYSLLQDQPATVRTLGVKDLREPSDIVASGKCVFQVAAAKEIDTVLKAGLLYCRFGKGSGGGQVKDGSPESRMLPAEMNGVRPRPPPRSSK